MPRRALFITSLALGLVASTQAQEDPVLHARAQRAAAQGIAEGDLPPVPRGIVEPPPLPPPEVHVKDSRKARKGRGRGKKRKPGAKRGKGSSAKVSAHRKAQ
ncbi:MAG: hypothetical protein P4L11_11330 [Geothrix sp.]|nr:hypothetical protein [Geothrix sp.]